MVEETDADQPNGAAETSEADQLRETVQAFLADVDRTYEEYDRGYADADATLRMLRSHVEMLREEVEG